MDFNRVWLLRALCGLVLWGNWACGVAAEDLLYSTLKSGTSIRGMSMGGAFTAIAEENGAFGYNPAGLALPGGSFRTDNYDYNSEKSSGYGGNYVYISPLGLGKWRRDSGDDAVDVTAFGFGRRGRGVDIGLMYKTISVDSGSGNSNGWSADIGALFRVTPFMDIGIVGQDVLKKDIQVPATVRTGVALFNPEKTYNLTADVVMDRNNGVEETHVYYGGEYNLTDGVWVRGGWQRDAMTGGLALSLPIVEIEYGFFSVRTGTSETIHQLGFKFGRGPVRTTNRRQYALFKPSSFAEFRVAANVVEGKSEYSFFNGTQLGSTDLIGLIREAADDPGCEGFVVHIGDLSGSLSGISMVQEIRSELEKAKAKGKYIAAYVDGWASLPEYYLASVATQIIMPELGAVGYLGIKLDVLKVGNLLSNFGITTHLVQSGRYKTMMSPMSPTMDASQRYLMEDLVYGMYRQVLSDIKTSRRLDWGTIGDVFDGHLITAREALDLGLIDKIGFQSDIATLIQAERHQKPAVVALDEFHVIQDSPSLLSPFNRIAVIEVDGEISNGPIGADFLFGRKATGAADIERIIDRIKGDIGVRGVVLRINSPGGSMLASDRILNAVEKLKATGRPVYVSMGNVAASGGYYIAMAGDRIFANPGTLTGSIGVVSAHQNHSELNEMLDIQRDVIKTGKYMDVLDTNATVSSEDIKMATAFQAKYYRVFTEKLKKYRNLTDAEVDQIAQGQIILGEDAQKLKIVDDLGNFYSVVDSLAKKVEIKSPELVYYRPEQTLMASLMAQGMVSAKSLLDIIN